MTNDDASPAGSAAPSLDAGGARHGRRLAAAAKVAVSLGLLAWLFAYTDRAALQARLAGAAWEWLGLGFALKASTLPCAALRWRSVATLAGIGFSRLDALRLTLASVFLGQALPGAVGGDIVRGWLTMRLGHPAAAVILAMVVDRVAALLGVTVLVLAGLPHLTALAPAGAGQAVALAAALVCAGAALLFTLDRLPLPGFLRWAGVAALQELASGMRRALLTVKGGEALLWSVLVHVCTVAAAIAYVRALGVPASLLDCLAVVPFSIIAAALPVSLAGWGMREGSMAAGFALLGLAPEDAVAVSLLIGVSGLLMSLPGAPVWLLWRPVPPAARVSGAVQSPASKIAP